MLIGVLRGVRARTESAHSSVAASVWSIVQSACLSVGAADDVTQVASFRDCQIACANATSFLCASVTFKTGECRLSSKNWFNAAPEYSEPCAEGLGYIYSHVTLYGESQADKGTLY